MATVNKDFRVKHGLVVEGSTATVNGSNVLTEGSTEFLQDTSAGVLTGGAHSGISFVYDDNAGVINATVSSTPTFANQITFEGSVADDYETIIQTTEPTQDNTLTLPNATDTLVGRATTDTLTNKTLTSPKINEDVALTATATELNVLDGITSSTAELNILDGATVSAAELNILDGATLSTIELNYVDGVTSGIQGQIDAKAPINNPSFTGTVSVPTSIVFEGTTADEFETTLTVTDPTADRTITLPNVTGTVITTGDTGTVTNTMLAGSIANDKLSNSAITINGTSTSLGGSRTLGTDDISEGSTNKYFTDERAQDAIGTAIANGTQTNITVTYDDNTNSLSFNATGGVASLTGTANEVEVTNVGTAYTVGLPNDITVGGNITINGTPSNSNHAATVAYVDAATAGLNVHASVKAATTANIDLSTALENGDTLDGVTLATTNRVLVKNQTTKSQNGIYVVQASGAAVRAADYNSTPEVDAGDFVFVEGGTANGKTGWVQVNTITTIGSDEIEFTQFSGAGTYLAGTGLSLVGNTFAIDTATTVDVSTAQTLTNKTLTAPSVSGLYLSDGGFVVEDVANEYETTVTFTNPTADRTITFKDASGTVAFTSDIPSNTDGLSEGSTNLYYTAERVQDEINDTLTAGTGITLSYTDNGGADGTLSITNAGVTGITGTTDQVTASASTGSVTLSLPQSIASTSSPTFASINLGSGSLTAGSVTLTDALIGTAVASLTDGSATVVDSWAVSSYRSAKYVVQLKKDNDIQVLEVLVTVDGNNNVYLTEYADVISNASIGTTDADYSSGNARLLVTASNGTSVKVHKTLIEA